MCRRVVQEEVRSRKNSKTSVISQNFENSKLWAFIAELSPATALFSRSHIAIFGAIPFIPQPGN